VEETDEDDIDDKEGAEDVEDDVEDESQGFSEGTDDDELAFASNDVFGIKIDLHLTRNTYA
jgi:hypothetical protein